MLVRYDQKGGAASALVIDIGINLSPKTEKHSESFELLLKFGKSSFLRILDQGPGQAQESSLFKTFWIPAFAGMTKWGYFSKLSREK
jgi:hypothetical protein